MSTLRTWTKRIATSRFAALIVLASTLALVVAGILATLYEEQLYRLEKVEELTVQGRILAASVTAALAFDDKMAAQEYVAALQANPEIDGAGVYDAMGMSFAAFTREGAEPLPQTASPSPPHIENDQIIVYLPVTQNGMTQGTVYLRAVLNPFARRLVRYGGIALLVAMAVLLIVVSAVAQRALATANAALESQAEELVDANKKLEAEMREREKTEEALRQTQKMEALGRLSGGIAHDFNNLLAIMKGNLQLIQRRLAQGRTDVQRQIDAASEGVNRAANLTQRILAFSRRQPLSAQAVNLSKLLDSMRDLLRHSVGDSVRIETKFEADWLTLCDPIQMENVVLNLAINARDAMPKGGKLTIETANHRELGGETGIPPGDYVRLIVRDTGEGMSEEVKRKAIDPFFTTKPPGKGTGMGLSMTFGYVQQSNGHLRIDSELGKGATITILMPRHRTDAANTGSEA
jgi:signal transduction histidine kinase